VIKYIIETGAQAFPLSHRQLKEHVDEICQKKYGESDRFPEKGVGKQWMHQFIVKHSDKIMMAWSTQLEDKQGWAVNPNTKAAWDKLLPDMILTHSRCMQLMKLVSLVRQVERRG